MTSNLDLIPDNVEDFYDHLGAAFGVTDSDWADAPAGTVGELADWLRARFGDAAAEEGACMTTMAFLRLRAAMPDQPRLGPASPLGQDAPRALFRRLRAATGLELPQTRLTARAAWASGLLFLGLPLGLLANGVFHELPLLIAALASWPLMIAVMMLDAGRLPADIRTVGDLARAAVPLNYGKLALSGGAVRPASLWDALTHIIAHALGIPRDGITRDTRLFATLH